MLTILRHISLSPFTSGYVNDKMSFVAEFSEFSKFSSRREFLTRVIKPKDVLKGLFDCSPEILSEVITD